MADRFDLDAIDADDALLDLLAAGGESARTAGEHDPAVKLLAELRLAVEVEDELPVETIDDPESFLARCAALNPVTDPFARKVATRGLALGVAAVAALSVSGVAAAVTGDPLSPYEKVIEKMVDAVRPQTSFPKEQLDGMPVVDKTKIVKVAKDFQKKQEERRDAEQKAAEKVAPTPPATAVHALPEVLQRVVPEQNPTVTSVPPTKPVETTKPADTGNTEEKPADEPTTEPSTEPTTEPSTEPTTEPSTPPSTDPTTPTTEPTSEPTTTPSTPPNNEETGETGNNPVTDPTTTPTTVPSNDTGSEQGSSDEGSDSGDTQPAEDPGADQKEPPTDAPLEELTEIIKEVLPDVLPTPTGAPVEVSGAEEFFGSQTSAKHSSGQLATGSVKQTYAKGKHSSGTYAEGKHAAIARAHGSTESTEVLQILDVVNTPTTR
ncbi:hypothetical protein AB0H36_29700 [Kribbella sp. NPDC050820]|uniref:hypothetical protein n=1 Tax=Kribbella sp. NPDC050820 TaxID=3155408 RepID=UPI0033D50DCC